MALLLVPLLLITICQFIASICLFLPPKIAEHEDEYTINRRAGIAHRLFDGDIDLRRTEWELIRASQIASDEPSPGWHNTAQTMSAK